MFLSCGFPSVVAGGRRRLVFADFGGAINSDDFELFSDGIITISELTEMTHQDFEIFTDGFVRLGTVFGSILAQTFEDSVDGATINVGFYNSITGFNATNITSGYLVDFSTKSEKDFEILSDGTVLSIDPLDATYPTGAGYFQIYL